MEWSRCRRAFSAKPCRSWRMHVLAVAGALALAGCTHDGMPTGSLAQPRGATVAFDIIDGLPPGQFETLVKNLKDEAQTRRLAVMSRESPSTYRVRGALTVTVDKSQTTVAWTWDVFDGDQRLALRIAGDETAKVRHRDAWAAADDAMLARIARTSMEQLAAFLTAPGVTPAAAPATALALFGSHGTSPESAGIYRMPIADPVAASDGGALAVPLPPRRQTPALTLSPRDAVTLSALRRH